MPKKVSTEISVTLGSFIRKKRKKAKLTQLELAEKMGLSMQQIQKYESGLTSMSIERVYEIADILDFDVTELVNSNGPKQYESEFTKEILKFIKIIDQISSDKNKSELFDFVVKQAYECISDSAKMH